MSNSAKAQYQGIQVRDSICANITYVSSLPSNYPGENFSYQWLPNSMMNNNTLANPIFVFPFGFSQLTYLRIRTGNTGVYYDTLRIVFQDSYPFDVPFEYNYCPNGVNTLFLNGAQSVLVDPPVFIQPVSGLANTFNINITSPDVTQFSFQIVNNFGCPTFPYTMWLTVAETLVISIPPVPDVFCLASPPLTLLPGVPNTGTYTINGIAVSQINPFALGQGNFALNYNISQNQCLYLATDTFSIVDIVDVLFTEIPALCPTDSAISFSDYISPFNGDVTFDGEIISVFDPSLYPSGQVFFNYSNGITSECSYSRDFSAFIKP